MTINKNDKLFSEKMSPEFQKKILDSANPLLKELKATAPAKQQKWWWSLGLVTASFVLALFIYSGQTDQTISADLAQSIEILESVDSLEELELLADLELIEELDVIEAFEEPS